MSQLRELSFLVRLGLIIVLVPFAIWEGIQKDAHYEANRIPQQKLARARDILQMWSKGIAPKTVPYMCPAEAGQCLREIVVSQADEDIKNQANKLLIAMESFKRYFAFADAFGQFKPKIGEYVSHCRKRGNIENETIAPRWAKGLRPKVLVISMGFRDASRPVIFGDTESNDQLVAASEPYFDAELIEACGDSHAQKPSDVATLVVLEWKRTQIGEYKLDSLELYGQSNKLSDEDLRKSGIPAVVRGRFNEACILRAFNYPAGRFIGQSKMECSDPEEMTFGSRSPSGSTTTGLQKLRQQVKHWLSTLDSHRVGSIAKRSSQLMDLTRQKP